MESDCDSAYEGIDLLTPLNKDSIFHVSNKKAKDKSKESNKEHKNTKLNKIRKYLSKNDIFIKKEPVDDNPPVNPNKSKSKIDILVTETGDEENEENEMMENDKYLKNEEETINNLLEKQPRKRKITIRRKKKITNGNNPTNTDSNQTPTVRKRKKITTVDNNNDDNTNNNNSNETVTEKEHNSDSLNEDNETNSIHEDGETLKSVSTSTQNKNKPKPKKIQKKGKKYKLVEGRMRKKMDDTKKRLNEEERRLSRSYPLKRRLELLSNYSINSQTDVIEFDDICKEYLDLLKVGVNEITNERQINETVSRLYKISSTQRQTQPYLKKEIKNLLEQRLDETEQNLDFINKQYIELLKLFNDLIAEHKRQIKQHNMRENNILHTMCYEKFFDPDFASSNQLINNK